MPEWNRILASLPQAFAAGSPAMLKGFRDAQQQHQQQEGQERQWAGQERQREGQERQREGQRQQWVVQNENVDADNVRADKQLALNNLLAYQEVLDQEAKRLINQGGDADKANAAYQLFAQQIAKAFGIPPVPVDASTPIPVDASTPDTVGGPTTGLVGGPTTGLVGGPTPKSVGGRTRDLSIPIANQRRRKATAWVEAFHKQYPNKTMEALAAYTVPDDGRPFGGMTGTQIWELARMVPFGKGAAATLTMTERLLVALRTGNTEEARLLRRAMQPGRQTKRPVLSSDANELAELQSTLDEVQSLRDTVVGPGLTGYQAQLGALLPNWVTETTGWGSEAKERQALIELVKQVIGKALEDGVLRQADEHKYTKILPTLGDPQNVVRVKLVYLDRQVRQARENILEALDDAGFDVSKFLERIAAEKEMLTQEEEEILDEADIYWDPVGEAWRKSVKQVPVNTLTGPTVGATPAPDGTPAPPNGPTAGAPPAPDGWEYVKSPEGQWVAVEAQ